MATYGYEQGRPDLSFVGHRAFGKRPVCTGGDRLETDKAVRNMSCDMGAQYRSRARVRPRAVREASFLLSFGHVRADFVDVRHGVRKGARRRG